MTLTVTPYICIPSHCESSPSVEQSPSALWIKFINQCYSPSFKCVFGYEPCVLLWFPRSNRHAHTAHSICLHSTLRIHPWHFRFFFIFFFSHPFLYIIQMIFKGKLTFVWNTTCLSNGWWQRRMPEQLRLQFYKSNEQHSSRRFALNWFFHDAGGECC